MNRRYFLASLAAALAGAAFDPERLLWVPGKKLISIPPPAPPMSLRFIDSELWAKWTLETLREALVFQRLLNRQHSEIMETIELAPGPVRVRLPYVSGGGAR